MSPYVCMLSDSSAAPSAEDAARVATRIEAVSRSAGVTPAGPPPLSSIRSAGPPAVSAVDDVGDACVETSVELLAWSVEPVRMRREA